MKNQLFNPYLPAYEYIPDAEPRVFDGRLYIFGSHDRFGGKIYCENDYVSWSTPLDDLSDWRYEGIIYRKDQDPRPGNLYAPDVVQGLDGRYYLYYSKAGSSVTGVAVCEKPAGQYEFYAEVAYPDGHVLGEEKDDWYQFDPAVLVDGDRIWLYSGSGQYECQRNFKQKMVGCMVIELAADMKTILTGPRVVIPGSKGFLKPLFFEGASIRRIDDCYYLVYSSKDNSGLNYATSSHPDKDFVLRGRIHSMSDLGLNGHHLLNPAYPLGNNHGGIVCLHGQWFIFNQRMTNRTLFSRQGVAEPIRIESDGTICQVESTSSGLHAGLLKAEGSYPAYIACNLMARKVLVLRNPLIGPYFTQNEADGDVNAVQYLKGLRSGCAAGYKYFDFQRENGRIALTLKGSCMGMLEISTDEGGKCIIGSLKVHPSEEWQTVECHYHVPKGKQALFFRFKGKGSLSLLNFTFKQ